MGNGKVWDVFGPFSHRGDTNDEQIINAMSSVFEGGYFDDAKLDSENEFHECLDFFDVFGEILTQPTDVFIADNAATRCKRANRTARIWTPRSQVHGTESQMSARQGNFARVIPFCRNANERGLGLIQKKFPGICNDFHLIEIGKINAIFKVLSAVTNLICEAP